MTFRFEVPNRGPVAVDAIEGQIMERGETRVINLAPGSTIPDGGRARIRGVLVGPSVATVSVSGSAVTVAALMKGSATIEVTATDPGGSMPRRAFEATVANRGPEPTCAIQ